jgi:hypothetical protein
MKLIIIYGDFGAEPSAKCQKLIDGQLTCGYREYAKLFGEIIYLNPVKVRQPWEKAITSPEELRRYIDSQGSHLLWLVKHAPERDRVIGKRRCLYYSCGSENVYNPIATVSLVDDVSRIQNDRCRVWFKGKDPDVWAPDSPIRQYDYLVMGRDAPGKNQKFFISLLDNVEEARSVLWIGGEGKIAPYRGIHKIDTTPMLPPDRVAQHIEKARVGILFTEYKKEGFPQSFLEMTMMGVPVVYNAAAPGNTYYFKPHNSVLTTRKKLIADAERLLATADADKCRAEAISAYSIYNSYENLLSIV